MRAVVLGGTGAIGGATAALLAAEGWAVDVTGRDASAMPPELTARGVRFHAVDRGDAAGIGRLVGDGADLLVDLVAFRGADVRALLPVMSAVAGSVVVSSRAVYRDPEGRHINGDAPPRFPVPLPEDTPTVPAAGDGVDPSTREGYAPAKVAVERVALDSGLPVTVIRPSKVHGRWARNARTRPFVEAMLRGDPVIRLAGGSSVDHLTAAAGTAALIRVVADLPGARILNSADAGTPTALEIVRSIGRRLGWTGELDLLDDAADPSAGPNPWRTTHPIVLDTRAAEELGHRPAASALELLAAEVDWLAGHRRT